MRRVNIIVWAAAGLLATGSLAGAAAPTASDIAESMLTLPEPKERGPTHAEVVRIKTTEALDALTADGDYDKAAATLTELFDRVIAHAPEKDLTSPTRAALALRTVKQLSLVEPARRADLLAFLRANPELAAHVAFLIRPGDKVDQAYALLDRLRDQRPEQAARFPALTAAVCVVHDQPLTRHINENKVTAHDPVALFDYYVKHEKKLLFSPRQTPAELLVYVVDSTAAIDEMEWALARYAGDQEVGKRFFDIRYDLLHFQTGAEKQVTKEGFTLENISLYGGVCVDQAYFAMGVGKAIGVPTAFTVGRSAEVGHAWVGFFQARGGKGAWNFDFGRYEVYRGVRGVVDDPQTHEQVPDGYVSMLAETISSTAEERRVAAAMADAAMRVGELVAAGRTLDVPPLIEPVPDPDTGEVTPAVPRTADVKLQLKLLERGLRHCPGYAPGWFAVRDLAKSGGLTNGQKEEWAGVLQKLCGSKYPDFTLAILTPMIESIEDPSRQNAMWEKTFTMFPNRADLAAEVRMSQAALWERQGDPKKAGRCYEDILNRFANAGPFVMDALKNTERTLRDAGMQKKVAALYEMAWGKTQRPTASMAAEFKRQSNWYQVGAALAVRLDEAGRHDDAAKVNATIKAELDGRRADDQPDPDDRRSNPRERREQRRRGQD